MLWRRLRQLCEDEANGEAGLATQHGYFLIADITGYTQYLSASELDHAQQTLTALLNLLIQHTRPPLIISRLAGDAVISYAVSEKSLQPQVFVEVIEDTYVSFRQMLELMVRNTTCPCNACRNIGSLDLKFFVHYGEFAVQKLDAHDELVGSDVNLLHRLTKNHVTEATGLKAYALYTSAAMDQLGLSRDAGQFIALEDSYEHLPPVRIFVQDMHPVWEAKRDALRIRIAPEEEAYRLEADIRAPREVVWAYFVQPEHINVLLGGDRTAITERKRGRVTVGSVYQCYHGESYISNVIVAWHPFESCVMQFTVPMPIPGAVCRAELRLEETATGTHLAEILSKATGPVLARIAADAGMKGRREHVRALMARFKEHIEADVSARAVTTVGPIIPLEEVGSSARAALVEETSGQGVPAS
jgi:uncharacterized protein YndB with AHSA1/START domain